MRWSRGIALCLLPLLSGQGLGHAVSPCDVNPFTRTVKHDGQTVRIHGSPAAGSPATARHDVRGGVCGALSVVHGTVISLEPVFVAGAEDTVQTLLGIDVARSWKAQLDGQQHIRLLEDLSGEPREKPRYAPFEVGDDCLLYLAPDSSGELMAWPSSLVLRDSLVLGMWALEQEIEVDEVFALVDSCAADRSVSAMVDKADLVIEGDVLVSWEDWRGRQENAGFVRLGNVDVHKGTISGGEFELGNRRGFSGWNQWPAFDEGERALLFLVDNEAIGRYSLVAGWQGKWSLGEDGAFHIGRRALDDWGEGVPILEAKRASPAPDRVLTRQELARALGQ